MKKAIFTVNLGGYDHQPIPSRENPEWDNILFTDQDLPDIEKFRWHRIIKVDPTDDPKVKSRDYKWRSHLYLPEYDLVAYADANMEVIGRLRARAFRVEHPARKNLRQEADRIAELGLCEWYDLEEQLKRYENDEFKDDQGLFQNNFFARFHNEEENAIGEMVYDHVQRFTYRDQLAYPYALWKLKLRPSKISDHGFFRRNVIMRQHKKSRPNVKEEMSVHHITPARSDKNFGKAINDIIKGLPDGDWICLRDIDTLPLDHISFIKQCEDIAKANEYGLVSCMTNRLGLPWQLIYDEIQPEKGVNMTNEIEVAKNMAYKYGSTVEESPREVAGIMMLFPKSVWDEVGGFKEGGIFMDGKMLDNIFYEAVKAKGHKVGIAKGIYLFHTYRWGSNIKDIEHLR